MNSVLKLLPILRQCNRNTIPQCTKSWTAIGGNLLPCIQQAIIKDMKILHPNPIQQMCIPKLLQGNTTLIPRVTLCAAETGSGKTLIFLSTIFHHLKSQDMTMTLSSSNSIDLKELSINPNETMPAAVGPRALVLLPTAELSDQVHAIAKKLSHTVKLRISSISKMCRHPSSNCEVVDIAIGTPQQVLNAINWTANISIKMNSSSRSLLLPEKTPIMTLKHIQHLVIDEADCMFMDPDFGKQINQIVSKLSKHTHKSTILTAATVQDEFLKHLQSVYPNFQMISSPQLHRTTLSLDRIRFVPTFHSIKERTSMSSTVINSLNRSCISTAQISAASICAGVLQS